MISARRILVAGVSGSGKSTLARALAARLGIRYTELDDLHWGKGWEAREDFVERATALAAEDAWVTEWQYAAVRPMLLARAELVVWLDPPTAVTMARVIRRTFVRRLRRVPLWRARLVEPPLWTIVTDRDHIIRWAWRTRKKYHQGPLTEHPDVTVVRLRSRREVREFLAG